MLTSLSNTNRPPPGEALTNLRNTFTDQTRLLTTDSTPQEQRIAAAKGILSRGDDIKSQLTQLRGSENLPESTRKQISTVKGQITRAQKEASAFLEGIGIDASEAGADLRRAESGHDHHRRRQRHPDPGPADHVQRRQHRRLQLLSRPTRRGGRAVGLAAPTPVSGHTPS